MKEAILNGIASFYLLYLSLLKIHEKLNITMTKMLQRLSFLLCISGLILTSNMNAQQQELKLWPKGAPGAIKNKDYKESPTDGRGRENRYIKVSDPTIKVYLPDPDKATGAAILICPGGGYTCLAYDHEGFILAEWLNKHGIAGILLKYRLPSDEIMEHKEVGPLQDAQQAMIMIRNNAKEWNIDPTKVGVIGFSAGGHLASTISTQFDRDVYKTKDTTSARPDFSILCYPVISMKEGVTHRGSRENLIGKSPSEEMINQYSNALQITPNTPITFMVHSANDGAVPIQNSLEYFNALQKNKVESEIHIFEKGGHGYGMREVEGTHGQWPVLMLEWLKMHGII